MELQPISTKQFFNDIALEKEYHTNELRYLVAWLLGKIDDLEHGNVPVKIETKEVLRLIAILGKNQEKILRRLK